ncbi:MAG: alpha/beta hydrolase, partial [Polyangiaceae bacterium]
SNQYRRLAGPSNDALPASRSDELRSPFASVIPPAQSRFRRAARLVAGGLAGLYGAASALGHLGYRVILYPARHVDDTPPPRGARLLELRAADGVLVHAMELPVPNAPMMVVYFHGNGEVIGDDVWMAERIAAQGLSVTLVEYRGYGRSYGAGSPSEDGLYADAEAVLDDLAARGVGADKIVLWGVSLGTGIAVEMARRGRGGSVVLVAPYTSIPDVASRVAPLLPMRLLIGDRFDNLAKAPSLSVPTVVVHGARDEVIPVAMGERVAAAIRGSRFERVEGGHHMDCFLVDHGLLARVMRAIPGAT